MTNENAGWRSRAKLRVFAVAAIAVLLFGGWLVLRDRPAALDYYKPVDRPGVFATHRNAARLAAIIGPLLAGILGWLLGLYSWVIIAAALISWVSPDPRNPIVMFLRQVTEPVLAPVRRLLPPWKTGGLDFSPLIVILAIQFVERVILPGLLRSMY